MIANARMYAVSVQAAQCWRALFAAIIEKSGLPVVPIEHPPPLPIGALWARNDLAAVFMCGLPYARALPRPRLLAAPVPDPDEFADQPVYWSEFVVRTDSPFHTLEDTFGQRIAFTSRDSQSGFAAALHDLAQRGGPFPLFREIIAPQITPAGALAAVANGAAEVAPIDAYALHLLQRFRPELTARVRTLARTEARPIPPLVASVADVDALRIAFLGADHDPRTRELLRPLLLRRFVEPDPRAYLALADECDAALNFWRIHPLAAVTHPEFALA
jgi:ABC-type phosphate/phosphonate transport system substrate-binding protein